MFFLLHFLILSIKVLAGASTALGCSVAEADLSHPHSHRCPVVIISISIFIILVIIMITYNFHNLTKHRNQVPGTPLFNHSSNGLQTSTLPPKPPGSALLQGNRWVSSSPCFWTMCFHAYTVSVCTYLTMASSCQAQLKTRPDIQGAFSSRLFLPGVTSTTKKICQKISILSN